MAVKLENNDRRCVICVVNQKYKNDKKHFKPMYEMRTKTFYEHPLTFFMQRDISDYIYSNDVIYFIKYYCKVINENPFCIWRNHHFSWKLNFVKTYIIFWLFLSNLNVVKVNPYKGWNCIPLILLFIDCLRSNESFISIILLSIYRNENILKFIFKEVK